MELEGQSLAVGTDICTGVYMLYMYTHSTFLYLLCMCTSKTRESLVGTCDCLSYMHVYILLM